MANMKPHEIAPEDCPEPFWHETHRYCPRCSYMEQTPPSPVEAMSAIIATARKTVAAPASEVPAALDELRGAIAHYDDLMVAIAGHLEADNGE